MVRCYRKFATSLVLGTVFLTSCAAEPRTKSADCCAAIDVTRRPQIVKPCDGFKYVPWNALQEGHPATSLIEYSVDVRGRMLRPSIVGSVQARIDDAAIQAAETIRFAVPSGWELAGGPSQRYRIAVTFVLTPRRHVDAPLPSLEPFQSAPRGVEECLVSGATVWR